MPDLSTNIQVNDTDSDERFWIHMSVLEIKAQAEFARMAFENIAEKPGTGDEWATFSSIHSFLSHCTLISKMLKAHSDHNVIEEVLDIPDNSVINTRRFRNHLEHYDERLRGWIARAGAGTSIVNHYVASKRDFPVQDALFVTFYDPFTKIFTFVDEDFNLEVLFDESQRIKERADQWLVERPLPPIE